MRVNLSAEQIDVVKSREVGNFKITGPAGCGKTLVAVERAIYLLTDPLYNNNPDDNVLITYYNKSLTSTIEKMLFNIPDYEKVKDRIKILNIDSFITKYLFRDPLFKSVLIRRGKKTGFLKSNAWERKNAITNLSIRIKIDEVKKKFGNNYEEFLLEEFDWIRSCHFSEEKNGDYVEQVRHGRGTNKGITKKTKEEILEALSEYRKKYRITMIIFFFFYTFIEKGSFQ